MSPPALKLPIACCITAARAAPFSGAVSGPVVTSWVEPLLPKAEEVAHKPTLPPCATAAVKPCCNHRNRLFPLLVDAQVAPVSTRNVTLAAAGAGGFVGFTGKLVAGEEVRLEVVDGAVALAELVGA